MCVAQVDLEVIDFTLGHVRIGEDGEQPVRGGDGRGDLGHLLVEPLHVADLQIQYP